MRPKLVHPLWAHIPAVTVLVGAIAYSKAARGHRPADLIAVGLLGVMYIGLSVLGDELWARQETRKTFNWLSLVDEAVVGFMAGVLISSPGNVALWLTPACAVTAAVIMELARAYRPYEQRIVHEDTSALDREIRESNVQGRAWVYWDVQNPWWLNVVIVVSGAGLAAGGISVYKESPWLAAVMLVVAAFLFALFGGMRTSLANEKIELRMGVFRLLRMRIADIASAEVHNFAPLRDFGGYGIRFGRGGVKAFFERGNRGVLLTAASGKKYLVGSDHPERLAAAINATMGQQIR